MDSETPIETAKRHVNEAEARIIRQAEVSVTLVERGSDARQALDLLRAFGRTLTEHKAHLVRLLEEDPGGSRSGSSIGSAISARNVLRGSG